MVDGPNIGNINIKSNRPLKTFEKHKNDQKLTNNTKKTDESSGQPKEVSEGKSPGTVAEGFIKEHAIDESIQMKLGTKLTLKQGSKEISGKITKIFKSSKFGTKFALISFSGLGKDLIMNLNDLKNGVQSGATTLKNLGNAAEECIVDFGIGKAATKGLFTAFEKAGAAKLGSFFATKAIPLLGTALLIKDAADLIDNLITMKSINPVSMADLMKQPQKNPDGSIHEADAKGLNCFDLKNADDNINVGELEALRVLHELGYGPKTESTKPKQAELGAISFTTAGTQADAGVNVAIREDELLGYIKGAMDDKDGKGTTALFEYLRYKPNNKALFRNALNEALSDFRKDFNYNSPDGVSSHLTPVDCQLITQCYENRQEKAASSTNLYLPSLSSTYMPTTTYIPPNIKY